MIVLCGVDEFPAGPRTLELGSLFADRIGAELVEVGGGSAAHHVARLSDDTGDAVLVFGHAPIRAVSATLREAPCPVVVAPAGICAGDWGEVVLGLDDDGCSESAAAAAGVLAARLNGTLRVVVLRPRPSTTGWQLYDVHRRAARAIEDAAGPGVPVEPEVREGPPVDELLRAADERDSALLVVPADPPPSLLAALRPSFTVQLLDRSRQLVVVVPPGAGPIGAFEHEDDRVGAGGAWRA